MRLDKVVCNHRWLDSWNSSPYLTPTKANYDHYPIMLEIHSNEAKHMSSFKFMRMWASHNDCTNVVKNTLKEHVTSWFIFVVNQILKLLKSKFKIWNREVF